MKPVRPGIALWIPAFAFLLSLWASPASAVPRYSARYEQNCVLCHVNPAGGGLRSLYATQFIVPAEMTLRRSAPEQMAAIDPQISKSILLGLDLRTIHHLSDREEIPFDNFLQMQGSVYLGVQLDPKFLAVVDRSMSGSGEVYGMGFILPYSGYVKAGRFVPSYGWRFDDHTQFVRQKPFQSSSTGVPAPVTDLGGPPLPGHDVGLEFAVYPGRLALVAAAVNGNRGSIQDNNDKPTYALQGLYRSNLAGIGLGLGGSFWHNQEPAGTRQSAGPYGYVKLGELIWLGEFDWSTFDPEQAANESFTGLTISQELTYRPLRGLELRATYDFHDPDLDRKNGARTRLGAGFELMPYPFVAVLAMVDIHQFEEGELAPLDDYTQLQVQAHFFY